MHDGNKTNYPYSKMLRDFERPDSIYAPYVFWFYDQDLSSMGIKPQEMAHQLASKGFNPGYAHARQNYAHDFAKLSNEHVKPISREQWMSPEWFDVLEKQALQAEADGSHACYADEFQWPSMQAAGRLVADDPSLRSRSLRFKYIDLRPGESAKTDECFFAVAARVMRREPVSYVVRAPENGWKLSRASFDQSPPDKDNTQPINMASFWSDAPDAVFTYYTYVPEAGRYCFSACWNHTGQNTGEAVYSLDGQEFYVDQRKGILCWNKLGDVELSAGMHEIRLTNRGEGRLSADAVKLTSKDGTELILDDLQTMKRDIAWLDGDSIRLVQENLFEAAQDTRLYLFDIQIQRGYDGSTIDNLQKRTSQLFYERAWRPHMEKLGGHMGSGRAINGIFSDHEGDYGYKMAWSDDLSEAYAEKYGEDIRLTLPLLIDRDVQGRDVICRFRWFDTVSDIYTAHFHMLSDRAAERDLYFTMHTWEESLQLQACCVGDIFKLNRGISLPGTDALCCVAYNPLNFKDHFSVAEFEGRRFMNEVMALNGLSNYTPDELKKQGNFLAAYGVSHVINHAVKMTRPLAQSVVTPDFYNIDPCWQAMGQYTDFIRRISFVNSNGRADASVLVLSPMDSMFALAENDVFDMNFKTLDVEGGIPAINASFGGEAGEINREYGELIRFLTRNRTDHLCADKEYVRRMGVCGGKLSYNAFSFDTVIVPRTVMMDLAAAEKLAEFAESGGKVVWIGVFPSSTLQKGRNDAALSKAISRIERSGNLTHISDICDIYDAGKLRIPSGVEVLEGCSTLLSHRRLIDGRHFVFICNNKNSSAESLVRIPGVKGKAFLLDPSTGEKIVPESFETPEGICVRIGFAPFGSFYLVIDPFEKREEPAHGHEYREMKLTKFTAFIDRGNMERSISHSFLPLVTDRVRVILRKGPFSDPLHPDVAGITISARGMTVAEQCVDSTFTVVYDEVKAVELTFPEQEIDAVCVSSERGLTSYRIEAWQGSWWHTVSELNTYSQSELIDPVDYPDGNYDVSLTDWSEWDFLPANFAGVITYRTVIDLPDAICPGALLELSKFSGSVLAAVNGINIGAKMFAPFIFDTGNTLRAGENVIEFRVSNTIVSNVSEKHGGFTGAVLSYAII